METKKDQLTNELIEARRKTLSYWNNQNNLNYNGWPVFHFSDFKVNEEVQKLFLREQPQIVVFEDAFDIENLNDFEISDQQIKTIIAFDEIEDNQDISDEDFELWMREDIKCGLGLINDTVLNNAFIIYYEGEGDFAPVWKSSLIDTLKEK